MAQLRVNLNGAGIGISKFAIPPAQVNFDYLPDDYVIISGLDDYTDWTTEFISRLRPESQALVTFETI